MDLLFLFVCTLVCGFWISKKIKEWRGLPPGPWGLPILGYLPFIDRFQPHLTLTELSKKYGTIYGIGMGSVYAVVLSDQKLIRDAFAKDSFSGRAPLYLTHGIMKGNGIICAEGALWKDQRKLITIWLKSFGMSKHGVSREKLEKRIAAGVYELLENVEKAGSSPMDLTHMLSNSLGNVVNEIIFGFKFPPENKTWHWLRQIQEEGCHEMGVAGIVNFLPFMRFISSSTQKTIEIITLGQAQTHRLYASVIERRRKMIGIAKPEGAAYRLHDNLLNEHPEGHIKCIKYSKRTTDTEEHYFDPNILIPTDGECILDNFLVEQKKRFETGDEAARFTTDEQLMYLLADMFGAGLDTTSNVEKAGSSPMDLTHMLSNSLGNVVNEIIFGFKFPPENKTWHWLRQIQEEGCHEMGVAGIVNFLPFMRFISSSTQKTIEIITLGQAQTHRLYASVIERRRKMIGIAKPEGAAYRLHDNLLNEHPEGHIKCIKYSKRTTDTEEHYFDPNILIPTDGECILDNFLVEQKKRFETGDEAARFTTDEQLMYLLADMFGAGLDTTSVTLAWFLLYMALYPDEQELVRKEILSVYPNEDEVDSNRLPYLMAAICETQRIRSIVPVGIPHGCVEDTYIGDYRIPKGAMVIPLQWAIHMDPKVWEEPTAFRPSRFLAPDGSILKPQEFIPFQTGKRMCPGDELSRMLSCGLVARLFRRRRVRLASEPPSPNEMQGTVGVTLAPPPVKYYCDPL